MSNISLRQEFHSEIATSILTDIQYQRSNYYFFLGKIEPWVPSDVASSTPQTNSELENTTIRTNALFVKKVTPNDASIVTTRHTWTSSVYEAWDHTKDMADKTFYCVNSAYNVYKCLDNSGGAVSTEEPTSTTFGTFKTSDGYTWKFMYAIPDFKRARFMTSTYMPVQKALSDSFYNKGSITSVAVSNSGSGYSDSLLTYITIAGTTTGSGAVATIVASPSTGAITSISLTNGGSGYTAGVKVAVVSSGGGAILVPVISGGVITGFTITNGGIGYSTGESLSFTVGGAVIVPSVSRVTGSITALKIIDAGTGYTGTPTLTVVSSTGFGTGLYGNGTALASCVVYNGSIKIANILDPGQNYPADTDTTITVSGDGSGAAFSPVIYNGSIVDVIVENIGSGYTSLKLTVVGTGSGAVLNPIIGASDYNSLQSVVEQTTVSGAIYSIPVSAAGTHYSNATTVTVTGDGAGCTAVPVIVSGVVSHIVVTNPGADYTYATVTINDTTRVVVSGDITATAYAVLPPHNGHGFDAVKELYGNVLEINTSLRQETYLNQLTQDYRQFGLLKNPENQITGRAFTDNSALVAYVVNFVSTTGMIPDEILLLGSIRFRIISVNGSTATLQQLGTKYGSPIGTLVAESENTRTYNAQTIVSYPTVNKYSGKLMYVSNENPFSFTENQSIVIKTVLKF